VHDEELLLSQRMEAVGRLASGVVHDFNNLLTVILGRCELLLRRLPGGKVTREEIEEIRDVGQRAASLTKQLLSFSRRRVLEAKVLDLNAVVSGMTAMLRRLIGENIQLVTTLNAKLGRVRTDPAQMEQVIMNLAINARDSMPRGGRLVIETADVDLDMVYARQHVPLQPGHYVMLAVSDTGCGMDETTRGRLFQPFFTTKEQGKGTGLGLSTVYGIVKQSGGYIGAYSEPGRGTMFKIHLPRVDEPVATIASPAPRRDPPRGAETILLAEDEKIVRSLAREILEAQGYTVLEARRGAEAQLAAAHHRGPIHLLLTDVVMPDMNGWDLAKVVTSIDPKTRVLFMSGYTGDAIAHHGVLDVGVPYLQKPFTADSLTRKVREVLDGHLDGRG
jgi:two-component system cell cycle sensor histidine kinase/response regulator CckA